MILFSHLKQKLMPWSDKDSTLYIHQMNVRESISVNRQLCIQWMQFLISSTYHGLVGM